MKINEKNLCVFATSPPYDKEGFLLKRGEVNKAFQKRYFVLKGNLLFYFEKRGDKEPLGLIIVEGCTIELSEESTDQYCFEIAFNGNRTYILSAESQESMESWMKALTCAGYEYKKLMVAELQRQLEEIEGSRNKITTDSMPSSNIVLTPKPPPRRTNPFNRPAPPLPGSGNGNNSFLLASHEMPFINGHFGSTSQRNNTTTINTTSNMQTGRETSPIPPPRGINSTHGSTSSLASNSNSNTTSSVAATAASRSEFFIPTQSITQQLPTQQHHHHQKHQHTHPHQQQHQQQYPSNIHSANKLISNSVFFTNNTLNDFQNHNNSVNFNELHEQFRQLVMKDILEYQAQRELKTQPLIQL